MIPPMQIAIGTNLAAEAALLAEPLLLSVTHTFQTNTFLYMCMWVFVCVFVCVSVHGSVYVCVGV